MMLGDAIAVLGRPSGITSAFDADNTINLTYSDKYFSMTIYSGNVAPNEQAIIGFFLTAPSITSHQQLSPWHGFIPKWRYCQLEPEFNDCPN
jgi:hypothetical protein